MTMLAVSSYLEPLRTIARQAGDAIMAIYNQDFNVIEKDDSSPLTQADLAAHKVICESLAQLTPEIPILSEESESIEWRVRQSWETFWLVDPLDGTKEFIKKNGEFTVNIALVHHGKPVCAVVYAPVLDKMYSAVNDGDQRKAWVAKEGQNASLLSVNTAFDEVVKVVGSRSHPSPALSDFLTRYHQAELVPVGSSLKFCLVAEGLAHIYPRLGPTSEWDTAAGHCVVEAAGGIVLTVDHQPLLYNQSESIRNPFFYVSASMSLID